MKRKKKQRLPVAVEAVKRGGAAMAATTRGRARTFKNRKKEADRKACRGKASDE